MRFRLLLPVSSAVAVALGVWSSRAVVAVADTSALPRRFAFLPPAWLGMAACAVAVLVCIWLATKPVTRRLLIPLPFLFVLTLPWLPVALPPAALIWTGPLRLWVWMGGLLAVVVAGWPARSAGEASGGAERTALARVASWFTNPRYAAPMALCLALCVYLAGARAIRDLIPGGDEPHYLIITQSLLRDGDLQIENNHTRGDYKSYFAGDLRPDFLHRGRGEVIYSIHAPGLPALVLPAFAVAGYPGVVVFLAMLAALGTWMLWRAAYRLTGRADAAWFAWASVALSTPYFFHAFTVYPDAVAGVVLALVAFTLVRFATDARTSNAAPWRWALVGLAIGSLPWLHSRYAVIALALGALLGLRLLGERKFTALASLLAPPALSAVAWLGYFWVVYGDVNPAVAYGYSTSSSLATIARALPALVFDQQYGLVPNAPVYALAFIGFASLVRAGSRRLAIELGVICAVYLLSVTTFHMWWAGTSAPARFAVPVLLTLGLPAAVFWTRQGPVGRAVSSTALALTVLITATLTCADAGGLVFNFRDGFSRLLEWLTPVVDLPRAFPSFLREATGPAMLGVVAWIVVLAGAVGLLRIVARRVGGEGVRVRTVLAVATPCLLACAVMVGASLHWRMLDVSGATPSTSKLLVLRAFDPVALPMAWQTSPFKEIEPRTVPARLLLSGGDRRPEAPDGPLLQLFDVPAGIYRVPRGTTLAAQGVIDIWIGRGRAPIGRWTFDPAARGDEFEIRLPVPVNAVTLVGDGRIRSTMPHPSLQPASVVPGTASEKRAARAERYGDIVVYGFDDHAYLESNGVWLDGGVAVPLAITGAAGEPTVPVLFRNGPVANRITLRSGQRTEHFDFKPGEERVLRLDVDLMRGGAVVDVTADRGFRPADVDPTSRDQRYLGIWLQSAK
jgi:hypothetical protein